MKKILLSVAIVATFILAGCSSKPDVSSTTFSTSPVQTYRVDTIGVNEFGNPKLQTVYFYPETATIKPTWGQSFDWAFASGYTPWFILSLVLVFLAGYVIYKASKDEPLITIGKTTIDPQADIKKGGQNINLIVFGLLVAALASFGTQPGSIRWNNNKPIEKAHYEQVVKETGSTKVLWDSLWSENKILWAGHKTKK